MSNMRGLDTQVRAIRRRVFKEVAKLGFEANSETLLEDMEAIPYEIVNDDTVKYRESTYRSRDDRSGATSSCDGTFPAPGRQAGTSDGGSAGK